MPSVRTTLLFATSALVLLIIPGPVVFYTIARSIHQGRHAGLASVVGAAIGDLTHVIAATLGLSAMLLVSAFAFRTIQLAGGLYLIYMGVQALCVARASQQYMPPPQTLPAILRQSILVSLLNARTALFFLAYLPQFVDASDASGAVQMLVLGAVFVLLGMLTNAVYALAASTASARLRGSQTLQLQRYIAALTFLALGVSALLSARVAR